MKTKSRVLRGVGVIFMLICGLAFGAEGVASSGDYKSLVDGILGGTSSGGASADAYTFTSEFNSLQEMLTKRANIARQLSKEGSVLLKNDGALPLNNDQGLNVTVLGNRSYTYTSTGELRDTRLDFYGGITGSKIYAQTVTLDEGTISLPVTLEDALAKKNIHINPALKDFYSTKSYSPAPEGSEAADAGGGVFN